MSNVHKCGHCSTAGQVCSAALDLDSMCTLKNLLTVFSRDSELALIQELEGISTLYSIQNTLRQQVNQTMATLKTIGSQIDFQRSRLRERVQDPTTLIYLLSKSAEDGYQLSQDDLKLLTVAAGWKTHEDSLSV
ncbi:hypothetical protein K435DRAFT_382222 [Dendrothele bispora CBS 962.96]|uniref:Uncharacterized protein n=1 Tax=Dendrothele bispora (strain CBS 962.96) TaxID=1314807 RepID=A0A4S8MV35_DENBC|nr:hypothetical protein K435DRAFT_382222 [Dendrothele bispora CBS 962.96]